MAGLGLNYTSGALNSGMGRNDVGVDQPFPVDSDLAISSDILTNTNIVRCSLSFHPWWLMPSLF